MKSKEMEKLGAEPLSEDLNEDICEGADMGETKKQGMW